MFKSAIDGIGSTLKSIFDFIIGIPELIWNLFKSAIDGIVAGVDSIVKFFNDFFELLLDFIKRIFVPKDNFFVDNFNSINGSFSDKTGVDISVLESLTSVKASKSSDIGVYTFSLFGVALTLNFSFIDEIQGLTLGLANNLVLIFVCWYHVKKVLWVIRGASPIDGSNYSGGTFVSNAPQLSNNNFLLK